MKLLSSLSLSLIFLFQSLGPGMDWCCELPKLDNLVQHFEELHEEEQVSFVDFITDHYGKEIIDHKDEHDEELPFQENHSCCHASMVIDNIPNISYQIYMEIENHSAPGFYDFNLDSGISVSVFQPPRIS